MRIPCPICGERDRREFYYMGHEAFLDRPAPDAGEEAWDAHVFLRDNPAGETRDLWYHDGGCGSWLLVTRDTVTHAVTGAVLAGEARK
jgi:heterotetrameric sarcosine oxidase delta subunit